MTLGPYFASSYSHILDAGNAYPASLGLLLVVAALLAILVLVLRRGPAAGLGGVPKSLPPSPEDREESDQR